MYDAKNTIFLKSYTEDYWNIGDVSCKLWFSSNDILISNYRLLQITDYYLARLFTFLLLCLWLLCSMVRSLVRLWFYGMWRMRMVGMVNIRMLVMLATYYSLYHRCSSSMDNWSRIYEDNFWETSLRNNYDP